MHMFNSHVFQNTVKKMQTVDALSILANVSKTEASYLPPPTLSVHDQRDTDASDALISQL